MIDVKAMLTPEQLHQAKVMEEMAINRFCHNQRTSNKVVRGIADVPRIPAHLIFSVLIVFIMVMFMISTRAHAAEHIVCRNPIVIDGDTIQCSGKRVRLEGIDARECRQPCYDQSARWLRDNTRGTVMCRLTYHDRYGRSVGTCRSASSGDLGNSSISRGYSKRSVYRGPKYR